jgi:predicted transcriptional regulator
MKYRSRSELVSHILEAANGGATKTKIMYKAFLSYAQLKEYLPLLSENGLLDYSAESAIFKTTSKGIRLLDIHGQLEMLVPRTNSQGNV